jgi:superfamily II DNA or RNA helicase/HKD family nuclease/diadenosine tetraphosphate (Ap4A) HIT family hydrolase
MNHACPFCDIDPSRIVFCDEHVVGVWDAFPVSPGHLLIVPRRHAATWGDLTNQEKHAVSRSIDRGIEAIKHRHMPHGFNVGFNFGEAAGQTVFHFHLHVIPRYDGDVPDPRGGVRHVIPGKANYLSAPPFSRAEQRRLVTGGEDHFLPQLIVHLDQSTVCDIAVAFLLDSGARLIVEYLRDFLTRGGRARIIVGDYLDVTDPIAVRRLADLEGNLTLRVYETRSRGFHLKTYAFLTNGDGVAFVGSSNLSETALTSSIEWNYKVVSSHDRLGFAEIRNGFENLLNDPASVPVTPEWIDRYEQRRRMPDFQGAGVPDEPPPPPPDPHPIQRAALTALEQTREDGFTAGLVVLATGLGKTWLAAFDSNRIEFQRILFVGHREEILSQAIETFRRVRPNARIGRLSGEHQDIGADLLFASVQTLGRTNHLSRFQPQHFNYIVIDEFHHAAAGTYRRVINHFQPKFLLGLTATPERTDGADLLGLCQENLVFQAGINEGITGGRLCPFHYFGVPDEVDYRNIPWRNAQFDPHDLTAAVTTEGRAKNALEQFRKLGGRRCIAFCCSQTHADFMAEFFRSQEIRAVAVHSGTSSAPRATSLRELEEGELEVIFAVDMFNEGVDVPSIDTVLMLRPTESTIIWMQQLGRGLRISGAKDRLTVIDYIGNHRAFLMKLRAIAALANRDAGTSAHLREILDEFVSESISLPPGCEVTYDLTVVDILRQLLKPTGAENALESFYREFEERHGTRPTAVEVFHAGLNPRSNSERSWLGFVHRMRGLVDDAEQAVWAAHRAFLSSIEKTEATRSYKIVLLLALLDDDDLLTGSSLVDLTRRVSIVASRVHKLQEDFSVDLSNQKALMDLLVKNPINAFLNAQGTDGIRYFRLDGDQFSLAFDVPNAPALGRLLREVLDWRLAQYLSRSNGSHPDLICRVARNASGKPILFLPTSSGARALDEGELEISVDDQAMVAIIAKIAINVVRSANDSRNRLPEILRAWFGDDAGLPGRSDRVRLHLRDSGWTMVPMGAAGQVGGGLRLWERYSREAIPAAFGLTFDQATWNAGFVPKPPHLFLLVTLEKDGMSGEHQYADKFISGVEFSWQSQNRTTRVSKHGQMIQSHREIGLHVHLLVRKTKKTGSKPTPFTYCGEVDFQSWIGDAPITVTWRLREPIPSAILTLFGSKSIR